MKIIPMCILWLLVGWSVLSGNVLAGDLREIELKDGSLLTAEVLSLHNGVYTLHSSTLGTITVAASKIRAIRQSTPTPVAPPLHQTHTFRACNRRCWGTRRS